MDQGGSINASLHSRTGEPFQIAIAAGGSYLLLPAHAFARTRDSRNAAKLFDRASLYSLALLIIVPGFVLA